MIFDITSPDSAFDFFNSFMGFSKYEWIDKILIECRGDIDLFIEKNIEQIASKDVSSCKYVAIHITTSNDDCSEIKSFGLKSLREVLSSDTELNRFLKGKGLHFDLINNALSYCDKKYDIDYSHINDPHSGKDLLVPIAYRLCYDPQVNGFLFSNNPLNYSTIRAYPEIIANIVKCFTALSGIGREWAVGRKPYVVTFAVNLEKIAWFTFYQSVDEQNEDLTTHIRLKKKLLRLSYNRIHNGAGSSSAECLFLSENSIVEPNEIIRFTPLQADD